MPEGRWFNPNLPQTLVIAQFLLYADVFWAVLSMLEPVGTLALLFGVLTIAMCMFGAYGIANGTRIGYRAAVVASFLPLGFRLVLLLLYGNAVGNKVAFLLTGRSVISAMFEYALIVALLHPQSKEHQKIWFS